MTVDLEAIQAAAERICPGVVDTRFEHSLTLSEILGAKVWLKFENLQFTSSFKDRGALNKLLTLSERERAAGVVAMSAGNHAKAVACHAQRLGVPATIVMPETTPNVKVEDTERFGAKVILKGRSLDESEVHARELAGRKGLVFVHPYDDDQIVAGQGTVALEMLAGNPELDAIVVPVGGGGLIAGVATAAKAIRPDIRIVGVEAAGHASASRILYGREEEPGGATIAEGIAVKRPAERNLEVIRRLADGIVVVGEEAIEKAIDLLLSIEKTVVEGSGAAGLAALMEDHDKFKDQSVGIVLCGANIDSRILAAVLMRRLVRRGRIVRYRVRIQDLPGTLSDIAATIGRLGGNILEVSHQRMFAHAAVKEADLYVTVETRDASQSRQILERLEAMGHRIEQLKD